MSRLPDLLESEQVLIEEVALAIAADAYPGLDVAAEMSKLDAIADGARAEVTAAAGHVEKQIAALSEHLYGQLGFQGNEDDYYDPKNSYLNDVLERRLGIPITLAVVWMAVGRRVGLTVEGIGFPGHFLVRVGGDQGRFVDVFDGGKLLSEDQLLVLAKRMLGPHASLAEGQLEPVDARAIAVRMLYNLQQIYERRGDHPRALVVCDRLVDIADAPFHLRDRGLHALALDDYETAADDLAAYLERSPRAADAAQVHSALERARGGPITLN